MPGKSSSTPKTGIAKEVKKANKKCFVICPIGADGSEERIRSNKLLQYVLEPVCTEYGFECVRADRFPNPGIITNQIMEHLVDSELVIADLTGKNANVFYELGIRHCTGKAYIQLIHGKTEVPFDIANVRTTTYSLEVDAIKPAQEAIGNQIKWIQDNPDKIINPVTLAVNVATLSGGNRTEQTFAELSKVLLAVYKKVDGIQSDVSAMIGGFCTSSLDDIKNAVDGVEYKVDDIESKVDSLNAGLENIATAIEGLN